jgi:hypothetical protein
LACMGTINARLARCAALISLPATYPLINTEFLIIVVVVVKPPPMPALPGAKSFVGIEQ